jgi:DnaJ family protein C protein 13
VLRGTGALVVISVLDFLTFALCAPYSETTDGAHFDALLAIIAKRGKELFRLLQHPSLSVIKGLNLLYLVHDNCNFNNSSFLFSRFQEQDCL